MASEDILFSIEFNDGFLYRVEIEFDRTLMMERVGTLELSVINRFDKKLS